MRSRSGRKKRRKLHHKTKRDKLSESWNVIIIVVLLIFTSVGIVYLLPGVSGSGNVQPAAFLSTTGTTGNNSYQSVPLVKVEYVK